MIIECINCSKKFDVNSELIPSEGRTIQCGSCNHVWFFNLSQLNQIKSKDFVNQNEKITTKDLKENQKKLSKSKTKNNRNLERDSTSTSNNHTFEIIKYKSKSKFTFGKFLSYILVIIISFIGLLILIDTFKTPLYNFFPNLENILFSLFETLKDITLFI